MQQKAKAEDRAAELTQTVVDIRADLEQKLEGANEALRVAEARAASLESALGATEARADAAVRTAGPTTVVAAKLSRERACHSEGSPTVTTEQAGHLGTVRATTSIRGEEEELWKEHVGRARTGEMAARDEATAARRKILELEGAMEKSRTEHQSFRERTERRLESLKLAVEEEELEQGAQVRGAF